MKKNLLVLLVVGLMVALFGAPAFATAGHVGHIAEETWVDVQSSDVSFDQGTLLYFDCLTPAEAVEAIESNDVTFADVPADGKLFAVLSVFDIEASPDAGTVRFTVNSIPDGSAPYALSGDQWHQLTNTDGEFSASKTATVDATISIADNSWADENKADDVIETTISLAEQVNIPSDGSGGGGCNVASIAPLAGLLVLPLLMLVKR